MNDRRITEITNMRFGAYILGVALATLGFGWALGLAVGIGVFGCLVALGSLLEKA